MRVFDNFRMFKFVVMFCFIQLASASSFVPLYCTASGNPTLTNLAPSAVVTVVCPQFDTSLGSLASYGLSFAGGFGASLVGTATVLNPSASPISATAGILDQWHVTTFAGSSQDQQRDITGNVNLAGNSSEIISLQGIGPIFSFLFKDQTANLASVIGTGSLQALTVNVATLVDPNL